jgi:exodeoxyribonuclease VII large subunit
MKGSQLDIFGGQNDEPKVKLKAKPKVKSKTSSKNKELDHDSSGIKRKRTGREVKKAPMLIDACQSDLQPKPEVLPEIKPGSEHQSMPQPKIFSISEITERIKRMLEGSYPDIWISGEVTDFRGRTSRHYYFALKDQSKNKIRAVIFNGASRKIPFELQDGLEVICHGQLDVYGPGGYYSIIIDRIEPKGVGALQAAFEELKKKLDAQGLFRSDAKKPIPYLPGKIGIVTSPTGAAIRDIIQVLARRFPNVEVLLYPVRVQGEGACLEIARAIENANRNPDLDVLIVGRGGGSIEDLWAFNEEAVARAIFASRIPIISAVGHEIDFTIADFVADLRAPTPSAAAEMAVPVKADILNDLANRKRQLVLALRQCVDRRGRELSGLAQRLADPRRRLPDLMRGVDNLRERMVFAAKTRMNNAVQLLSKYASNLDHLSPLGVLAKGYCVAENLRGHLVKRACDVALNDILKLKFHEGSAEAVISKVVDGGGD